MSTETELRAHIAVLQNELQEAREGRIVVAEKNQELESKFAAEAKRSADWIEIAQDHCAGRGTAESHLATAIKLPGLIWEALGELTSYLVDGDPMVRVDEVRRTFERFLAGQPAAPQCDYPASWCTAPGCDKCRSTHPCLSPPAAPTRTEADAVALLVEVLQSEAKRGYGMPAEFEERAQAFISVATGNKFMPKTVYSCPSPMVGDGEWEDMQAELARRGLK